MLRLKNQNYTGTDFHLRLPALIGLVFISHLVCASSSTKIDAVARKLNRLTVEQSAVQYLLNTKKARQLWKSMLRFYFAYPDLQIRLFTEKNKLLFKARLPNKAPTTFVFEDGDKKEFQTLLETPDLADTFAWAYPTTNSYTLKKNMDPGRVRYLPFFKYLYGNNKNKVKKNLVYIKWAGTTHPIHSRTQQAFGKAFKNSGTQFKSLPKGPATFNWRFIAGTKRLSNHSFGISIDLNPKLSAYWRWDLPEFETKVNTKLPGPPEHVIKAFESAGFIWGGKWYHYDTMHFEYRPEFFVDPKLLKTYSIE